MQKWEYLAMTVKRDVGGLFSGVGDWQGQLDLTQIGEEGWELVSTVPHSDEIGHHAGFTSSILWVFKRPKP